MIKREYGDYPDFKVVLTALASGGGVLGSGAMLLGVNSARAFSSAVSASASWLLLPAAVIGAYLEDEMAEKRKRFFDKDWEKKSLEWQEKIKGCQEKFLKSIENLKALKSGNAYAIKKITNMVADAQKEYCGAMTDYNALKGLVK